MHLGVRLFFPPSPRALLGAVALLCAALAGAPATALAAEPIEFSALAVGKTVYRDVRIKSRDARSVFFTYDGG
ncbi:MAG: hypothetical protein H7067_03905, partial [Burkholderiales bacterium]|nr:hypothetical protein [Opitutaceae bacterium]